MITALQLVEAMNEHEVQSFVAKTASRSGKPKTNVSLLDENGKRCWVNRVKVAQNADGTAKYGWALGAAMRDRVATEAQQ